MGNDPRRGNTEIMEEAPQEKDLWDYERELIQMGAPIKVEKDAQANDRNRLMVVVSFQAKSLKDGTELIQKVWRWWKAEAEREERGEEEVNSG